MKEVLIVPKMKEQSITLEVDFDVNLYADNPFEIKSAAEKDMAFEHGQKLKAAKKRIESERKSYTDPLNDIINRMIASAKVFITPMDKAELNIKNAVYAWDMKERARIDAENEKARVDAQEKARKEREKLEKQAEKAQQSGKVEKAESLRTQADIVAQTPVVAPVIQQQKTSGQSYVDNWEVEIVDKALIPLEYMEPNLKALKEKGNATAGKIEVSGVKFVNKPIMRMSSKGS